MGARAECRERLLSRARRNRGSDQRGWVVQYAGPRPPGGRKSFYRGTHEGIDRSFWRECVPSRSRGSPKRSSVCGAVRCDWPKRSRTGRGRGGGGLRRALAGFARDDCRIDGLCGAKPRSLQTAFTFRAGGCHAGDSHRKSQERGACKDGGIQSAVAVSRDPAIRLESFRVLTAWKMDHVRLLNRIHLIPNLIFRLREWNNWMTARQQTAEE